MRVRASDAAAAAVIPSADFFANSARNALSFSRGVFFHRGFVQRHLGDEAARQRSVALLTSSASGQEALKIWNVPLLQVPGLPLFLMEQVIQMRYASMPVSVGEAAKLCRSVLRSTLR
jgi:hypothetical protein